MGLTKIPKQTLDNIFSYIKNEAKKRGTFEKFEAAYNRLRYEVTYYIKEKQTSTTTLSECEIALSANFLNLNYLSASATLIHEAKHLEQYEKLGRAQFLFQYLISPLSRMSLELEAEQQEIRWRMSLGKDLEGSFQQQAERFKSFYKLWFIKEKYIANKLESFYKEALEEFK